MLIKVEIELEVPKGAEYLLQHKDNNELVWFKDDFNLMTSETEYECEWDDSNFDSGIVDKLEWMKSEYGSVVLWSKL